MKKFILSCIMVIATIANAANHFSVGSLSLTPGSATTFDILLDNEDSSTGFQFTLILPEGITLNPKTTLVKSAFACAERLSDYDWVITNVNDLGGNTWNIIAAQLANIPMNTAATDMATYGSTAVITVRVNVASSYTGGAFGLAETKLSISGSYFENTNESVFNGTKTLTLGANGYSSYSECAPVEVSGATVKGATISGNKLTLSGTGNVVPANTGVILKGTEGATVTITAASSVSPISTDLTAAVVPTTVEAKKTMVLSTGSQGTGFYVFTGTTITANKAYLASVPSSAPLRIVEDETTGIEEVESEANVGFNYNLMGQQIKSQKGFAIENGKKVVRF